MPVLNTIAAQAADIAAWRRYLHAHPELSKQEAQTAAFVAARLREFGVDEVHEGIGGHGVVGLIHGAGGPATAAAQRVGLRADMDALPILEVDDGRAHRSTAPGVMHACGHDGHTAMLLGAARQLAGTRNFAGSVVVVFQPAEEDGAGAEVMLRDGLLERFPMRAIYGLHIWPGLPVGTFGGRVGPALAATTEFHVSVTGRGAHAAHPETGADPVVALAQIIVALQTAVSRGLAATESAVLTVTRVGGGRAQNVIPNETEFEGTIRSFSEQARAVLKSRLVTISEGVAAGLGCRAEVEMTDGYPVLVNDAAETGFALDVAREIAGADNVFGDLPPSPGAEDFAYFLQRLPGSYLVVGNGETADLHHPAFDFADEAAPYGASWWVRLAERALPR